MKKIGITGNSGFIGRHLTEYLKSHEGFSIVPFSRDFSVSEAELRKFVSNCDAIIHLAALSRHENDDLLYATNIDLVRKLINAMEKEHATPHMLFASTTHEPRGNVYHHSKREGRRLFDEWAARNNNARSTGMLMPNCFGPGAPPYYNSFIATFCYQLANSQTPEITVDAEVELIYIDQLCEEIAQLITGNDHPNPYTIPCLYKKKVSEVLKLLESFKNGFDVSDINDKFARDLFTTFKSYLHL